ncbi:MFS transporter [Actinospica durhamensis]|uniref:MFS transporter n=1 Tax=Actinospica durhamensis TaxID=1508375 RepID=A0A941EM04_9ACTN|nr:MFS transporter [Actinospica durhamensis]MBR7833410.1 MFS transporter [Actinospica durhamensis]
MSSRPTGAFPALRVRDYRLYWSAGVLSNIGTAMQGTALDWYVLSRTHSGTAVGWTAGLQFAPVLLFGLWGGVVADRRNRRNLQLAAQSLYALQALILTVAVFSGHGPVWLVYLLAFTLGCVFTVENPARLSFVAELVGRPLIPNAAGLNILSFNAARLVGPAIAGVLISAFGTGWVFAVNTASFAAVLAALLAIRPRAAAAAAAGPATSWLRAPREGLRYILDRPGLVGVFAIFGLTATLAVNFPITLTLFAGRVFDTGSTGLGLMNTALSVGTVAGTLTASRSRVPGPRKVVISALLFAAAEAGAAYAPEYRSFLLLLIPVGFLLMTLNTAVSAYAQTHVDEAVRGRVMAFYTVVSMGATPLGGPAVGWISQHAGARSGLACSAALAALGTLGVGLWLARASKRAEPGVGPMRVEATSVAGGV